MGTSTSTGKIEPWRYRCPDCGSSALKVITGKWIKQEKDYKWRCDVCGSKLVKRWDMKREKLVC